MKMQLKIAKLACVLAALWVTAPSGAQEIQNASDFAQLLEKAGANYLGESIQQTSDGGYIMSGVATTTVLKIMAIKLDSLGKITWQNSYAVSGYQGEGSLIQQTSSGYILCATLDPQGGTAVLLVMSLDPSGDVLWQNTYPTGGTIGALPWTLEQTTDGGYLLGATDFDDFEFGTSPLWALKLDANGNVLWQKVFGFNPGNIHATSDGGFILAGYTSCNPTCNPVAMKLDSTGNVVWQNLYQIGSNQAAFNSARQTADGGYLASGEYSDGSGTNVLLMQLDSDGNVEWQAGFSSSTCSQSGAYDAQVAAGGGYFLYLGDNCAYNSIAKLDQNQAIQWQEAFQYTKGGLILYTDWFAPTSDGGYIAAGSSGSLAEPTRLLALKVNSAGELKPCFGITAQSLGLAPANVPTVEVGTASIGTDNTAIVPVGVTVTPSASKLTTSNGCLP
jgi:hypothetical protein